MLRKLSDYKLYVQLYELANSCKQPLFFNYFQISQLCNNPLFPITVMIKSYAILVLTLVQLYILAYSIDYHLNQQFHVVCWRTRKGTIYAKSCI